MKAHYCVLHWQYQGHFKKVVEASEQMNVLGLIFYFFFLIK
jgi:hypothetical protein